MAGNVDELFVINEYGFKHQDPAAKPSEDLVQSYKQKYNIRTDVHRTCVNCQIRQIAKYEKEAKATGADPGFKVQCEYIPKGLPKGSKNKLQEIATKSDIPIYRAKKLLLSTIDPVAWAELMFGFDDKDEKWHIRGYQKEQLRCSSKRLTVREGRRSGKTFIMALKLLYYAFNMKVVKGRDAEGKEVVMGPDIMIVTPYQAQLTNFFEEMEKLVKRNVELRQEITTGTGDNLYIKTPTFKMELKNGAVLQGFVSGLGVKEDGSGGGTMRGQSAHVIYLDEMDMIPEDILDKVINPILATTPETALIATSTPIGKRAKFYNWCVKRPDFKEDYYPSTVLSHWNQIKDEIESESTKESFNAEYMAEFIEGSYGVFKPSWIQNARADYEYMESGEPSTIRNAIGVSDTANMLIAIGVDWNKNAGTEFYVAAYSPSSRKWFGLDAVNIPSGEYSSKLWMEELIRLNYKWKPDWIYADEGYGHTIIEDLILQAYSLQSKPNKNAVDLETVKLKDRLISFNFSKNVILKDPVTSEEIKKSGKHFLVENAVRTFEDDLFRFPASDEVLKKQLFNYIIKRRNPNTNKPVYGMDNERIGDHRLDAMMLALAALALEESVYSGRNMPISTPSFSSDNPMSRNNNEPSEERRMPKAVSILKLLRSGSDSSGRPLNSIQNQQASNNTGNLTPNRGKFIKSNSGKTSILEELEKKIGTSQSGNFIGEPVKIGRSLGNKRGSRSWRKK